MATGTDIIEGALRKLKVISPEIPIESHYLDNGLEDLNDFGALMETSVILGFTPLSAVTSTIDIPREAEGMYKSNLAIYIAPQYGLPLDPLLISEAANSKKAILRAFKPPMKMAYPDSLPIGSGNDDRISAENQKFFDTSKETNF